MNRVLYARNQVLLRKALLSSSTLPSIREKCTLLVTAAEAFTASITKANAPSDGCINGPTVTLQEVTIPGAKEILISFDARCYCSGVVSFYTGMTTSLIVLSCWDALFYKMCDVIRFVSLSSPSFTPSYIDKHGLNQIDWIQSRDDWTPFIVKGDTVSLTYGIIISRLLTRVYFLVGVV